ncbi:Histone acetyltransferase [Fusarium oxysporum]|nr:Histone acetyltransferase [Fusarium oxysporum]
MAEELPHSVMVSDEDAEYETAGETGGETTIIASRPNGGKGSSGTNQAPAENGDAEFGDHDASGEDVDASGEEDNDYMAPPQTSSHDSVGPPQDGDEEDHENVEGDEEHEEDDVDAEEEEDVDAEGEDYEEDEGVGAVKFQPGTRSDDDDDSESDKSESPSANDEESDEEAAWEDAAEAEEDHEDEETAASSNCIFCGHNEDEDPSEEFEVYLACVCCGGNAHQQCARDAAAMSADNTPEIWKCPECFSKESDVGSEDEEMEDHDVDHNADIHSQQSDVPEVPGEHESGQHVNDDEDASSQSDNDSELDEEPIDAPRSLRKRKSSSLEDDGNGLSLRKRRRNQSQDAGSESTARNGSAEPGRHHPPRTVRLKVPRPPPVSIEKRTRTSLVLKLHVKPGNLKEILSRKKREKRRQPGSATRPTPQRPALAATPAPAARANLTAAAISNLPTPFTSDNYSQPFYSFYDREADEMKGSLTAAY